MEVARLPLKYGVNERAQNQRGMDAMDIAAAWVARGWWATMTSRIRAAGRFEEFYNSPQFHPKWRDMLWMLGQERLKSVLYPPYRDQSRPTSAWL
jgi:hypothetical protein